MSQKKSFSQLLGSLDPIARPDISYDEFLGSLPQHVERAWCSPAVILKAIEAMGFEKAEDEKDPERKQYLEMLQELGYKSYLAFKHVAGSQRFIQDVLVRMLESATTGGDEIRKYLIIEGPSGSGKDYIADGVVNALEMYGTVYTVVDCPDHENPLNLLKLFERKHRKVLEDIAKETGLGDRLFTLLKVASMPCAHCRKLVMGCKDHPKEQPNFDDVKVRPLDISQSTIGVAKWEPGDDHTLVAALRQGNRGFVNLPDAFIHRELEPGKTDERLLLLSAPQYRRLPGLSDEGPTNGVAPPSPMDTFIVASTNRIAFEEFLKTVPDKEAFTLRAVLAKKPYNLVRVEEVRAYNEIWSNFEKRPALDPLVMKIIATVAILSRYTPPDKDKPFAHPLDMMRLYQGEQLKVKPRPASDWSKVWSTDGSSSSSSDYGYDRFGSRPAATPASTGGGTLSAEAQLNTALLWKVAPKQEGMAGLDMRTMPRILGAIKDYGLKRKDECVNSIQVILLLRAIIASRLEQSSLTEEQQQYLRRCLKWLGGKTNAQQAMAALEGADSEPSIGTATPDLVEAEYRRMLRDCLLKAFAPDYEERAQELFETYRLYAPAIFEGKKTVNDKKIGGQTPVENGASLVDELDCFRLGKTKGSFLSDTDKEFRGKLDAVIGMLREQYVAEMGQENAKNFKVTWTTIPDLAQAIRNKLDGEIGTLIEKLITTEVASDLKEFERQQLERADKALKDMGFCDKTRKPVLEYAKRTKVWSFKLDK